MDQRALYGIIQGRMIHLDMERMVKGSTKYSTEKNAKWQRRYYRYAGRERENDLKEGDRCCMYETERITEQEQNKLVHTHSCFRSRFLSPLLLPLNL